MTGTADVLVSGGRVFDGTGRAPVSAAVAVAGGRILAVGTDDELADLVGTRTTVVDAAGGLVTPGFHDAHVHPVYAGLKLTQCALFDTTTPAAAVAAVADYAQRHPQEPWILGGGWSMATFPGGTPTAAALDAVVPDRPVLLTNRDGHGAWVNSAALRAAGITAATPDPVDGRIERDEHGNPTGTLHEGAAGLVAALAPEPSQEHGIEALRQAQQYLFSLGITGWQDAIVGDSTGRLDNLQVYLTAQQDGWLQARVVGALWWQRDRGEEQVVDLLERRAAAAAAGGRRFTAGSVKIMQDGVAENFTAALTKPYLDGCGHHTDNAGISFVPPDALSAYVSRLDAEGFQVHFHALGDRAVREALDAFEVAARDNSAGREPRHHIAHIQVVHPRDVPRFAALDVSANLQPLWACHEPQMDELTLPFLDPDVAAWQYPFGDLARAGARLVGGSDWSVSSPDVMWGAHVAVNRIAPQQEWAEFGDRPPAAFLPEQQLTLAQALTAYTAGSAYVNHLDHEVGTITVGKAADLVVLDRDPFGGPADAIDQTRVRRTYLDGECVYAAD
jgi:predicted amidohydrolase YtcJ